MRQQRCKEHTKQYDKDKHETQTIKRIQQRSTVLEQFIDLHLSITNYIVSSKIFR